MVFKYKIALPDSLWSNPMLFHLRVISMYKISTEAIEKLLLLSLQFLLKMNNKKAKHLITSKLPSHKNPCKSNTEDNGESSPCILSTLTDLFYVLLNTAWKTAASLDGS